MALREFSTHFPLLCPRWRPSQQPHEFRGFITIAGDDREVVVVTPHFPGAAGMQLHTDTSLQEVVEACRSQLDEAHNTSKTALQYLRKFEEICTAAARKRKAEEEEEEEEEEGDVLAAHPNEAMVRCLLHHLEELGWARVQQVSKNLTSFTLQTRDARGRMHLLRVKAGEGYPEEVVKVEADLPEGVELTYEPNTGLPGLVRMWEGRVSVLQEFWDVMDEMDESLVVLDPPTPSRQHTFRRLLLDNQVNVQVHISPEQPHTLPRCLLFGPSKHTKPLAARLNLLYEEWDPERRLVENLEHVLGVAVVRRRSGDGVADEADEGMECPICYCLHYDSSLPDQPCEHCFTLFHTACLYDWLSCFPNVCQTMDMMSGECPKCCKSIICKVPT